MSPDEAMNRVDANKDGAISLNEQLDFSLREADSRFARMDRDKDGRLTSQELADAEKRRQAMKPDDSSGAGGKGNQSPPGPQSLMTRADSNHDGAVDSSENRALAREQATKRFQFEDKNRDGSLDRSELQKQSPQ